MATTQVAVRLDDEHLEALDWLVARCEFESRADVLRVAIEQFAKRERQRQIGEQIADGYRRIPPTPEEDEWAASGTVSGLPDEDWSDWF